MILRHGKKAPTAPLALLAVGLAIAAGCGDGDSSSSDTAGGGGGGDSTLTLVGYTTPREVYEEVIPAFQATPAGEGIEFEQSYGPSGDQSRAVEAGLDADVLALSLAPDITRLEEPAIVAPGWQVTREAAALGLEKGRRVFVRPRNERVFDVAAAGAGI